MHVYSDTSGSLGCGAFNGDLGWFQLQWPPTWQEVPIAAMEMLAVVTVAAKWGHRWYEAHVALHVDNMAVVAVLQHQAPKILLLIHLLRCLIFYSALYHFDFSSSHIPGSQNTVAYALSCGNLTLISASFPQVPRCLLPQPIRNLLLHHPPDWTSPEWISTFMTSLKRRTVQHYSVVIPVR